MSRHLEGTMRGARRRPALLLAPVLVLGLALIADVSGRRAADGYLLDVTLPGWPLAAVAAVFGGVWWVRRRRSRRVLPAAGAAPAAEAAAPDIEERGTAENDMGATTAAASNGTADATADATPVEWIAVRSPRAITLVAVDDISHIEAAGRYARVHADGREHLAQHSLAELERMLDGLRFVRVHRSAMVNLRRIRSLRTADYRDFELVLDGGATVRLSRNYRARLEAALGLRI